MKQRWRSTATMVANMEAPHQYLSVWRDSLMMKLKIFEWEAIDSGPVEPDKTVEVIWRGNFNCNAKKSSGIRPQNRPITIWEDNKCCIPWACKHFEYWSDHPPYVYGHLYVESWSTYSAISIRLSKFDCTWTNGVLQPDIEIPCYGWTVPSPHLQTAQFLICWSFYGGVVMVSSNFLFLNLEMISTVDRNQP